MNPELGGGDVSYQAYGILLAERFETVCPDAGLCSEVQAMIVKGLQWEEGAINSAGQVSLDGSTRTELELSRSGTIKTVDYKTMVQAFSVATTITPATHRSWVVAASGRIGKGLDCPVQVEGGDLQTLFSSSSAREGRLVLGSLSLWERVGVRDVARRVMSFRARLSDLQ